MGMVKRGVLVVLIFLILIQLSFAYPTVKTYDENYNYVQVDPMIGGTYFRIPISPVTLELDLSEYSEGTEIRLCRYSSSAPFFDCNEALCSRWRGSTCIGGWTNNTYAKAYVDDTKKITITYSISSLWNFQIVKDNTEVITGLNPQTEIYRFQKISSPITAEKINCVSGCISEQGILTYSVPSVFTPDTCANHIQSLIDYSTCPPSENCVIGRAYNISSGQEICGLTKYNYLDKCGKNSEEFTPYFFGREITYESISDFLSCNSAKSTNNYCLGNSIYSNTTSSVADELTCSCKSIVTSAKIKDCLSSEICVSGSCIKSISTLTSFNILNTKDTFVSSEKISFFADTSVEWTIQNVKTKDYPVFMENGLSIEKILSVGDYILTAKKDVTKTLNFKVVSCILDSDCSDGLLCMNEGTIESKCVRDECNSNEDCHKKIKSLNPLAYDIVCNNPLSVDSKCTYKNLTCQKDEDCITKVPVGSKGIKCNFPNTIQSSCEYAGCNIICETDEDCDDKKDNTVDSCLFPSSCQSECKNIEKFKFLEPQKKNYFVYPKLDYILQKSENCKLKINNNIEIITRLPMTIKTVKQGNNSFTLECESFTYNSWFLYNVEEYEEINYSQLKKERIAELSSVLSKKKLEDISKEQNNISNKIKITNEISEKDGVSEIKTTLETSEELEDIEIYLKIPKCMAKSVKELEFDNEEFKVLIDDPVIMWHFKEITSTENLIYRVKKTVSEECFSQLKVMTTKGDGNTGDLWLYVAIIPVVLFAYVFFSKYAITAEEDNEGELEAVKNYVKILEKRINRLRSEEFSDEKIKEILMEEGIEERLIDRAL